ncbi:crotonase/enoyl-CoA hydratase family protein [Paracoccus aminophilus]|uniref:Methylglutaconyl-CoA hydratase n=1 Tax=Paracoccus aminophilus JCM 7686 TaxID=1367847 RepID=S5XPY2_PARAH|nr:crotonase/enoyl-CoA hydratase family protein [Paracoccus aminophilus]AGT09429.1 methylglutaconyl-CoA hydratase [Paracoccus aminophilus JCM 7686]
MFKTIRITREDRGLARLELARPAKHNALSAQMIAELTEAAQMLGADPQIRVVVLAAEGPSFCAGGDLGWMQEQMAADSATRRSAARALALMLKALNEIPKPLIGRVQGNAFGGGLGLISVCDIAFAAEEARFGLTEVRLGLIPATIAPYVLARIGAGQARRMFFSGQIFGAPEAVRLGLLAEALPARDLDTAVETEVERYLHCAPAAVAAAKRLCHRLGAQIDAAVIEQTVEDLVAVWDGDEAQAGLAAFFGKRPPPWQS